MATKATTKKSTSKTTAGEHLKTLIIAEKPSVANDIAKALGGFTKYEAYFESDEFLIASAVGHLLEIAAPEEFDVKRGKWSFANLPVVPPCFDLRPIAKTESRLKVLQTLIKRTDVTALINACDAGREGELIFRLIAQHAKASQSIKRLWLQSMTPAAIREGFANLRTDEDMKPLADAARCRSEADWLVGINGTRAMTAFNSKSGGFFLTTVGRVQTPTLSIVVEREELIRKFGSKDYWEVKAEFMAASGVYEGRWFDPKFKKDVTEPDARENRLWSEAAAQSIVTACRGKKASVTEEAKPARQLAPQLFDLTSLQREANARFGFSAKNTLGLAQALYERHKALTYPRTDAKALPEDYLDTVKQTMENLADHSQDYRAFAKQILQGDPKDPKARAGYGWIKPNKSIFDNSKISDHFAIIPTLERPKNLSEPEAKLYDLVVRRFLAVFYPAAEFRVTTCITEASGHHFKTEGRVLVSPGWLTVYGKSNQADNEFAPVQKDETVQTESIAAVPLKTKPPARYTEATLLSAMESAGKWVDDEMREVMAEKGLGTPATRAAIIEGLLAEKYIVREARELIPTAKAFQLMTLLRGLDVEELTRPDLTGSWENKLSLIEQGKMNRDTFMQEIAQMTQRIVKRAKEYDSDTIPGDYAAMVTPCPHCKGPVKENYRRFACETCGFTISKTPGGRAFEYPEVEELLREKTIGPLQGFRSKIGRPFAAIIKLSEIPEVDADYPNAGFKLEFDFGNTQEDATEPVDLTGRQALGACPKCSGAVYEDGMRYVCENNTGPSKSCDFKTSKVVLQQEVSPAQVQKLLKEGKTDLLANFKSNRTGRGFKAYLALDSVGKISFEFAAKAPKAEGAAPAKKRAGASTETKSAVKPKRASKAKSSSSS
ncbi:DNA topoisomerase III [Polynucleobacter necessarius]|uniref:DNA topoisomerase III n=1 Tax=Polynucleobacter necessarius TaxID=576610 RepID=UPI000E091C15